MADTLDEIQARLTVLPKHLAHRKRLSQATDMPTASIVAIRFHDRTADLSAPLFFPSRTPGVLAIEKPQIPQREREREREKPSSEKVPTPRSCLPVDRDSWPAHRIPRTEGCKYCGLQKKAAAFRGATGAPIRERLLVSRRAGARAMAWNRENTARNSAEMRVGRRAKSPANALR
jgi:hypothetical protein